MGNCVFATDSKMPLVVLCKSVFAVGSDWAHCEWARKMMAEMGKVMADMDYRNLERKMFLCKVRSASPHCFAVNPLPWLASAYWVTQVSYNLFYAQSNKYGYIRAIPSHVCSNRLRHKGDCIMTAYFAVVVGLLLGYLFILKYFCVCTRKPSESTGESVVTVVRIWTRKPVVGSGNSITVAFLEPERHCKNRG